MVAKPRSASAVAKERATNLAQAQTHGGLVVLAGGVWDGNVLYADEYARLPESSTKRVGYVATEETVDNRLGFGPMRVQQWRGTS